MENLKRVGARFFSFSNRRQNFFCFLLRWCFSYQQRYDGEEKKQCDAILHSLILHSITLLNIYNHTMKSPSLMTIDSAAEPTAAAAAASEKENDVAVVTRKSRKGSSTAISHRY